MKPLCKYAATQGGIFRRIWLLNSVSQAVGLDLNAARAKGQLHAVEYSRMLTNCGQAGCDKTCALWLSQQPGNINETPDFCANSAVLKRLKR